MVQSISQAPVLRYKKLSEISNHLINSSKQRFSEHNISKIQSLLLLIRESKRMSACLAMFYRKVNFICIDLLLRECPILLKDNNHLDQHQYQQKFDLICDLSLPRIF